MNIKYNFSGIVLGNYWGGGSGSYSAKSFTAESLSKGYAIARKKLADGSLDSGMGYESLIGALINVEILETIEKDGKEYTNRVIDYKFIGKMTKKQKDFLSSIE